MKRHSGSGGCGGGVGLDRFDRPTHWAVRGVLPSRAGLLGAAHANTVLRSTIPVILSVAAASSNVGLVPVVGVVFVVIARDLFILVQALKRPSASRLGYIKTGEGRVRDDV
jgi:hypothetical protein